MRLEVDAQGLISGLDFESAGPVLPPAPTTWQGVDAAIRSAAPQVRLLVAEVTGGSCRPVHGIDPGTAAPLGSAFKLYVLAALATAIAAGKVSWAQPLTVTAQLKSLLSDGLQNEPDGTRVSVQDAAAKMISISDNTAADMLINLVGRPAVEAALTTGGMADPSVNQPFLTTRELFILRLHQWPALARRYIAASQPAGGPCLATWSTGRPCPRRPPGQHHETSTASNTSHRPTTSATSTRPSPRSPGCPACPRSPTCSRSATEGSDLTRPSGRRPGSRADPSRES